jgi:hypothetical protein
MWLPEKSWCVDQLTCHGFCHFPAFSENLLSVLLKFLTSSSSEIEVRHVWRTVFVKN